VEVDKNLIVLILPLFILAHMKKAVVFACIGFLISFNVVKAQYWTSGGEIIFSFADYRDSNNTKFTGPPRFTLFFHFNYKYNIDLGNNVGIAAGVSMKNVGFITAGETFTRPGTVVPVKYDKIKRRSYTFGIPIMLKLGNMKKDKFLALGAEYDLFFHFKEKTFLNGNKDKRKAFMSDETKRFVPSVFVGLQLWKYGMLKVQYYLDDFLNQEYVAGNSGATPYAGTTSKMMYVSWSGNIRTESVKKKNFKKSESEYSAMNALLKNIKVGY